MDIGVEAEVTNRNLTLVGNMEGDPGDKLQVIHSLHLFENIQFIQEASGSQPPLYQ